MLILFDLDGTLITSYMDEPARAFHRWQVLPGRREKLADLLAQGHTLGIVTNQGGVAMGHIREQDFERKIASVLAALHLEAQRTPVAVAYGHPASRNPRYRTPKELARRKPRGGMIRELVAQYPEAAAEGVLFVGDRDQDRDAALDAGVDFQWADEYF